MKRLAGLALLMLAACASGPRGHPDGHGHRDSPGRAAPSAVPMPGYEYRFRPDPQGLGRDLPPLRAWGRPEAREQPSCEPCRFEQPVHEYRSYSRGYSERMVREHRETAWAGYQGEVEIITRDDGPGPLPYEGPYYEGAPTGPSPTEVPYSFVERRPEPVDRHEPSATEIPYSPAPQPSRPVDPNVFY